MNRWLGFGLLEAIISLALLAGTGLALLNWIQQSLQSATRLQQAEKEARLLLTAQALMELVNPAERAEGSLEAKGISVSWQSQAVETPRLNTAFADGMSGTWQVGLYRLAVKARDDELAVSISFYQMRTGLKSLSQVGNSP